MTRAGTEAEGIRGFLSIDIKREIKRGSRLKCSYCRKKGATVGCAEPRCKKTYHLPCGSSHNSLQQYYDQFKSFCKEHRPTQKARKINNVADDTASSTSVSRASSNGSGGSRSDTNLCTICQV